MPSQALLHRAHRPQTGSEPGPVPSRPAPAPPNSRFAPRRPRSLSGSRRCPPRPARSPCPATLAGREGGCCGQWRMEGGWEGSNGDGGAPYDVFEPSHHMTAPADEAVPPSPVPGDTARLPLPPRGRRGTAPDTAALSSCGDEVRAAAGEGDHLRRPRPLSGRGQRSRSGRGSGCGTGAGP